MNDVFTIVSVIVIIASLTWSIGMLIFALIKKLLHKHKLKKAKQEVLEDEETEKR